MEEITMYQCEICNEVYFNQDEALECERKGKEVPLVKVGQHVEYEVRVGGGFDPFYVEMRVKNIEDKGHFLVYHLEEYDEDENEWYESGYVMSGIWGNEEFLKLCKIK